MSIVKLTEIRLDPKYPIAIRDLLLQKPGLGKHLILIEFRIGSGGGCTLYVDSRKVATAGGYGYDKRGVCLANWFTKTFQEELKAIFDQPKYQKQLKGSNSGPHKWYCTNRSDKGEISINGMSGKGNVIGIMEQSVGLTLRYIGESKATDIYMLARV